MISEVVMPQMGADMTEGTVLRWLKNEGDEVSRGEIIAEIETDKANVEIEAFEGGVFRKALASEGDTVPVGGVIALIGGPEDDITPYLDGAKAQEPPAAAAPSPAVPQRAESTTFEERPPTPAPPKQVREPQPAAEEVQEQRAPAEGRVRISPVARRLADENGLDVQQIRGTGPDGRIVKRDVETALAARGAAPAPERPQAPERPAAAPPPARPAPAPAGPIQMSRMRQAIARRMVQAKAESPHYYLLVDIDMTEAAAFRKQANESLSEDERISINDLIVKACALALARHPRFNVTSEGDQMIQHESQNVCIAIALEEGLIAPAIVDAGSKSLPEIARETKDLVQRARGGSLRPEELTSGTFSITNLGAYGIETLIGIIQPPQTAILGVGSATKQPLVRDGEVVVRDVMKVALSADHRVTDGALGAQFLAEIKNLLEHPLLLVL